MLAVLYDSLTRCSCWARKYVILRLMGCSSLGLSQQCVRCTLECYVFQFI